MWCANIQLMKFTSEPLVLLQIPLQRVAIAIQYLPSCPLLKQILNKRIEIAILERYNLILRQQIPQCLSESSLPKSKNICN